MQLGLFHSHEVASLSPYSICLVVPLALDVSHILVPRELLEAVVKPYSLLILYIFF